MDFKEVLYHGDGVPTKEIIEGIQKDSPLIIKIWHDTRDDNYYLIGKEIEGIGQIYEYESRDTDKA